MARSSLTRRDTAGDSPVHTGRVDTPQARHNRPVERLAAVLVLAVGALLALGLFTSMGHGSPLGLIVGIALIVLIVQTMRRAWPHLHR